MKIILASASPRRKEILSMVTNKFDVIVSNIIEEVEPMLTNEEQVKHLAYIKAEDVFFQTKEWGDRIVIGSDTIVVKDGLIYGKPKDKEEAVSMLSKLKNAKHEVMTGICIFKCIGNLVSKYVDVDITSVFINDMTQSEIEEWVASGEAYDKAGGYAIQGKFGKYIEKIEGNYYTVVGLPIQKVYQEIKNDI